MLAILRQTIRYAHHYGADYVYITDYRNALILCLPSEDIVNVTSVEPEQSKRQVLPREAKGSADSAADSEQPAQEKLEGILDWAWVDDDESLLALTYLVWRSGLKIQDRFKEQVAKLNDSE